MYEDIMAIVWHDPAPCVGLMPRKNSNAESESEAVFIGVVVSVALTGKEADHRGAVVCGFPTRGASPIIITVCQSFSNAASNSFRPCMSQNTHE
jgi:hypothetical protein